MKRRLSILLAAVTLLGVAGITTSPVHAAKPPLPMVDDPKNDVELFENQAETGTPADYALDIKWMKVSYTDTRLKANVRFFEPVDDWSIFKLLIQCTGCVAGGLSTAGFSVDSGLWVAAATPEGPEGLFDPTGTTVECAMKFKVNASRKLMRLTVPSSCFGAPATLTGVQTLITADTPEGLYYADKTTGFLPLVRR